MAFPASRELRSKPTRIAGKRAEGLTVSLQRRDAGTTSARDLDSHPPISRRKTTGVQICTSRGYVFILDDVRTLQKSQKSVLDGCLTLELGMNRTARVRSMWKTGMARGGGQAKGGVISNPLKGRKRSPI